jgi:hypothetical protein
MEGVFRQPINRLPSPSILSSVLCHILLSNTNLVIHGYLLCSTVELYGKKYVSSTCFLN